MPNFADCVARVSTGTGKHMREYLNPSREIIQNSLSYGFPRFSGPWSRAEEEAIKNIKIGGLTDVTKALEDNINKKPVNVLSSTEVISKASETAKIPADVYKGYYLPKLLSQEIKPYTQGFPKNITQEEMLIANSPAYIEQLLKGKV